MLLWANKAKYRNRADRLHGGTQTIRNARYITQQKQELSPYLEITMGDHDEKMKVQVNLFYHHMGSKMVFQAKYRQSKSPRWNQSNLHRLMNRTHTPSLVHQGRQMPELSKARWWRAFPCAFYLCQVAVRPASPSTNPPPLSHGMRRGNVPVEGGENLCLGVFSPFHPLCRLWLEPFLPSPTPNATVSRVGEQKLCCLSSVTAQGQRHLVHLEQMTLLISI